MKILVAGDYCPKGRVERIIEQGSCEVLFKSIKDELDKADYSIVNFETCVADKERIKPIKKCGPALCCTSSAVEALKIAGFDCCTLANNHFNDYGEEGILNSISELKNYDIDYVGAGNNIHEAGKTLYKEINGKTLAIINCCEHEFSIASETEAGCNPLDSISQYYAICEAKKKSDFIIVIVHGGLEHIQIPQLRLKRLYRFFVDAGADAVINHHQHCVNGMEVYKNKPIFYGLGNLCFDWEGKKHTTWNEGYMVKLDMSDNICYEIIPYNQCNEVPGVQLLEGQELLSFEKKLSRLSALIQDESKLINEYESYIKKNSCRYGFIFEPYSGRVSAGLYFRKLLPSFVKRNLEMKLNFIECESHRESLIMYLKSLI